MSDAPKPSPSAPLPPTERCFACGYDLRGSGSQRCPECGRTRESARDLKKFAIHDPAQFYLAKAALERERLLADWIDPGGKWGPLQPAESGGTQVPGWISIERTDLDRAEEILDELGIPHAINTRPIVDRAEPICPKCDTTLDLDGPEQCPRCRVEFHWVETGIGEGFDLEDGDTLR